MSEKKSNNPAARLLTLLTAAVRGNPQSNYLQLWSTVFELQHLSGRQQKVAVSRGIDLIYEQLDLLVEKLKGMHYAEDSYQELVSKVEQNISAEYMSHPWQDFRVRLETIIYPLRILSSALPPEESLIDAAELKVVLQELDKLEQSLSKKEIAPEMRGYVKRQLNFIRRAIWEYQFRGVQAFDDAVLDGIREAYVSRDTVEHYKNEPEVQEVSKLWVKVWDVVIKAGKVGAAITAGEHFYRLVESTLKLTH